MWHVICGDVAAAGVAPLVARQQGSRVRVLRDDLAVGPLQGLEALQGERAAFWHALWPAEETSTPEFGTALHDDARWLDALGAQDGPVTVWHGDSASEQLMLARVAAALEASAVPFLEVDCGTGESRTGQRRAVGMCPPEQLAGFQAAPVSAGRRQALAAVWRQQLAAGHLLRRWCQGRFVGSGFEEVDAALEAACGMADRPLPRVMAEVMQQADGYFPTDYFLYWRARELAARGRLILSGDPQGNYPALSVRRA